MGLVSEIVRLIRDMRNRVIDGAGGDDFTVIAAVDVYEALRAKGHLVVDDMAVKLGAGMKHGTLWLGRTEDAEKLLGDDKEQYSDLRATNGNH